jgi:hypothetical protein
MRHVGAPWMQMRARRVVVGLEPRSGCAGGRHGLDLRVSRTAAVTSNMPGT